MKPITKNFDPFAIAFFVVAAIAMTTSGSLWAQSPWPNPLFPPLEQPQAEAEGWEDLYGPLPKPGESKEGGLLGNAFCRFG